jgi:hypothetical protein
VDSVRTPEAAGKTSVQMKGSPIDSSGSAFIVKPFDSAMTGVTGAVEELATPSEPSLGLRRITA